MPLKIISLSPASTEILYALGLGGNVAAVTRFCDYPEEARLLPRVGGWLDVNLDVVKSMAPDAVVTSTFLQDKIVDQLEKMKITAVHVDPITLEDVYESILSIGKAFDRKYEAEAVVAGMRSRISKLNDLTTGLPPVRVYIEEWHRPPMVSGNWVPDIIEAAGGNGIAKRGERSRPVSLEEVRNFDPEHMVISWCGFGEKADREELVKRDSWALTRAAIRGNIHVFDDSALNRPGPRLAGSCEALARILHPEAFR